MLIYLPSGPHGEKVGVDDYLADGHSVDELLSLATSEIRSPSSREAADASPLDEGARHADILVAIGRTGELFHDPTGVGFANIRVGDHGETWGITSKRFRQWLRREFFRVTGQAVGAEALNSASGLLEGIAVYDGAVSVVHNRVGSEEGLIHYDLADADWRVIEVGPDGWRIREHSAIRFRRYAHQLPQVEPARGGDIRLLLSYLNVRAEDQLLLLVWLVTTFVPDIPHPIPDFHGEKGAGKSVGQRALRRLVDPSTVESLSFPADVKELVQQLAHHYAPIYE